MTKPDVLFVSIGEIKIFHQGYILYGTYYCECGIWCVEFGDWVMIGSTIEELTNQISIHFQQRRVKV